jgi:hypothetical protein
VRRPHVEFHVSSLGLLDRHIGWLCTLKVSVRLGWASRAECRLAGRERPTPPCYLRVPDTQANFRLWPSLRTRSELIGAAHQHRFEPHIDRSRRLEVCQE